MSTPRELFDYPGPRQRHIDLLKANGVAIPAMIWPDPIRRARGGKVEGGFFLDVVDDEIGEDWLAFGTSNDIIYWYPKTGELATAYGRAFALGEELITDAFTYSFDGSLVIYADPLEWLRNNRKGIVIVKWEWAFDRLRDCPRIAIPEDLVEIYQQHMQPRQMPQLFVITGERKAA